MRNTMIIRLAAGATTGALLLSAPVACGSGGVDKGKLASTIQKQSGDQKLTKSQANCAAAASIKYLKSSVLKDAINGKKSLDNAKPADVLKNSGDGDKWLTAVKKCGLSM